MVSIRFILLLSLAMTGCQWLSDRREAKFIEPALPTSIGKHELVDYLNAQNHGLECWRCMNTQVHVSMPGIPLPQNLSGTLACAAPSQFRLVSDNMIAHADFGSNGDICWAYIKPGESTVLTWKHEDSHLLQHLPGGLPRLEPNWLMTVLGVQPLNPDRYELQHAPQGSRELWLVSVEDAPDGTSLRRVIKVDTVSGMAREHALYNQDGEALLRAQLSDYKSCGHYRLPHTVRIHFPMSRTHLTLGFRGIETDCQLADSLWRPPQDRRIRTVDLGDLMRTRMQMESEFRRPQTAPPLLQGQPFEMALIPDGPATDGFYSPNELRGPGPTVDQIGFNREENGGSTRDGFTGKEDDNRYFGPQANDEMPDWDDALDALGPDESGAFEQSFEEPRNAPLLAPDFDVVTPQQRAGKRRRWLPFMK